MTKVSIGGGFWLEASAADWYTAARLNGCPGGVTEAGRSYARQVWLYGRWRAGLLKAPSVARPGTSLHETGIALDLPEPARSWMRANGARFGWVADRVPGEPWHFEFVGVASRPHPAAPKPAVKPIPLEPEPIEEEDTMYTIVSFGDSPEIGLYNPRTDAYVKVGHTSELERMRAGLITREVKFLTKVGFASWRAAYGPTLKG